MLKWIERCPILSGLVGAVLVLIIATVVFAADYSRTYDVVLGVDSPKSAITKLEATDIELLEFINELKGANAGTAAPTGPDVGEFWFDTGTSELKQYYAATWNVIWSMADTTTNVWEGVIDADSGTIDNLEANTITASYGTVTDIDVDTATINSVDIGSASINTLSYNWSFAGAGVYLDSDIDVSSGYTNVQFTDEVYDTNSYWVVGTPHRLVVPSGVSTVRVTGQVTWRAYFSAAYPDGFTALSASVRQNGAATIFAGYANKEMHGGTDQSWYTAVLPVASGPVPVSSGDYFTLYTGEGTEANLSTTTIVGDTSGFTTWLTLEVLE